MLNYMSNASTNLSHAYIPVTNIEHSQCKHYVLTTRTFEGSRCIVVLCNFEHRLYVGFGEAVPNMQSHVGCNSHTPTIYLRHMHPNPTLNLESNTIYILIAFNRGGGGLSTIRLCHVMLGTCHVLVLGMPIYVPFIARCRCWLPIPCQIGPVLPFDLARSKWKKCTPTESLLC